MVTETESSFPDTQQTISVGSTTVVPIIVTIAVLIFIYQMFKAAGNFALNYIAVTQSKDYK